MNVVRQLEDIANAYLGILAEGGIQLILQGEEDADKIVKSVVIRSADGTYKERALSQLSGGQWRRVSMALDFAFAEVIRRRGALRSNLIVMDEVLTHLDASGRLCMTIHLLKKIHHCTMKLCILLLCIHYSTI
jgi:energy-coupling factor transporter ATP-binding protein EcfA2